MHPTVAYLARLALHANALHTPTEPITLGTITLLPHQVAAVHWLQHRITRCGGALLADPPGLGKTFVALAIVALRQVKPLVIAPAALRQRWLDASQATHIAIDFLSTERLSAPKAITAGTPAFVIIDEAHHLRTASTRRYRRTAALCERARVLLLTATPIHNRPQDLEQLTSLFHLPPARASVRALRRLTLRRTIEQIQAAGLATDAVTHLPRVEHRGRLTLPPRGGAVTRAITRVPARDASDRYHGALLGLGLLHALQSSDAACRGQIRTRIATTLAVEQTARAQIVATPSVRKAWISGSDAIQLAMPQLLGPPTRDVDDARADAAEAQRAALERVLPFLHGEGDVHRARVLRRLARWCAHPVVAFTQFAATAETLYRHLRHTPGIAMLCGEEARIASGVIPRHEVLARLLSSDRAPHHAVRLLITTDVLSEGLSLSGVATIVHLDLPWTAARLDQRVGRAARIGSTVGTVRVVELPASTPLGTDRRQRALIRRKRENMLCFEERPNDELARIAAAHALASAHASARPHGGDRWVTVFSDRMAGQSVRVVAIVHMLGRRQLVAFDDGWLRAPSADDWLALQHAMRWSTGASRRARETLVDLLREHVDDEEMRRLLGGADDERLIARREADGRLLASHASERAALAPRVSAARVDVSTRTSVAQVREIPAVMQSLESKAELRALAGQTLHAGDARITLCAGVVIRPA